MAEISLDSVKALSDWLAANQVKQVDSATKPHEGLAIPVIAYPATFKLSSLKVFYDAMRDTPEARVGTAVMLDLDSFIAHANRFKNADTAIFADDNREKPLLLSVIDYHDQVNVPAIADADTAPSIKPPALPRFGQHRGLYEFPLSDEWKAWSNGAQTKMTQGDFAAFMEERIVDVIAPPTMESLDALPASDPLSALAKLLGGAFASPGRLVEMSRSMAVMQDEAVKQAVNLSTGEMQVSYETSQKNPDGQAMKAPNLFLIGVPVFRAGAIYQIAVRLRYRLQNRALFWSYDLFQAERIFDHAFKEASARAGVETGLPVFLGRPEPTAAR